MPRYVVLLRGVNVGKGNRVPMAGFKTLLESLGYEEVRTLLNSGNAVLRTANRSSSGVAAAVRKALSSSLGLDIPVVVKSDREFAAIVEDNRLAGECSDPSRLLVAMAPDDDALRGLAGIAELARAPEKFVLGSGAAYLHCAGGILESAAAAALLGRAGRAATTRNWATVGKLQALLSESAPARPATNTKPDGPVRSGKPAVRRRKA